MTPPPAAACRQRPAQPRSQSAPPVAASRRTAGGRRCRAASCQPVARPSFPRALRQSPRRRGTPAAAAAEHGPLQDGRAAAARRLRPRPTGSCRRCSWPMRRARRQKRVGRKARAALAGGAGGRGQHGRSRFLLLGDLDGTQTSASQQAEARQRAGRASMAPDRPQPRPYQVLLREAQQAHSRGDLADGAAEISRGAGAAAGRRHAARFDGLTGTPSGDAELDRTLVDPAWPNELNSAYRWCSSYAAPHPTATKSSA